MEPIDRGGSKKTRELLKGGEKRAEELKTKVEFRIKKWVLDQQIKKKRKLFEDLDTETILEFIKMRKKKKIKIGGKYNFNVLFFLIFCYQRVEIENKINSSFSFLINPLGFLSFGNQKKEVFSFFKEFKFITTCKNLDLYFVNFYNAICINLINGDGNTLVLKELEKKGNLYEKDFFKQEPSFIIPSNKFLIFVDNFTYSFCWLYLKRYRQIKYLEYVKIFFAKIRPKFFFVISDLGFTQIIDLVQDEDEFEEQEIFEKTGGLEKKEYFFFKQNLRDYGNPLLIDSLILNSGYFLYNQDVNLCDDFLDFQEIIDQIVLEEPELVFDNLSEDINNNFYIEKGLSYVPFFFIQDLLMIENQENRNFYPLPYNMYSQLHESFFKATQVYENLDIYHFFFQNVLVKKILIFNDFLIKFNEFESIIGGLGLDFLFGRIYNLGTSPYIGWQEHKINIRYDLVLESRRNQFFWNKTVDFNNLQIIKNLSISSTPSCFLFLLNEFGKD